MNIQLTVTSCIVASCVENEQNEKVCSACWCTQLVELFSWSGHLQVFTVLSFQQVISDQHDEPAIIYWHQLQALSCNELSACQLRRRRHAENETAIDMSWYWSKRLKAMANWLLCLKARSYLTWPLSTCIPTVLAVVTVIISCIARLP